jgi:hypothetical protein
VEDFFEIMLKSWGGSSLVWGEASPALPPWINPCIPMFSWSGIAVFVSKSQQNYYGHNGVDPILVWPIHLLTNMYCCQVGVGFAPD